MRGGGCLDNTTLPARPVTRNCLRPCHCGLIPVCCLDVSFSCLRSAVGVSFDIEKACRKPYSLNIFFRAARTQQYRGFELDRQETSATEVHMSSLDIVGSNLF